MSEQTKKHYHFDPPVKPCQRGTRIMSRTIIFECLQCGVTINCGSANTTKGIKLMVHHKQEHDALHKNETGSLLDKPQAIE
jgi:hypothetical protein